ncbi:hypothetical protein ACFLZ0_00560 [Patescibacteria group bacterium]
MKKKSLILCLFLLIAIFDVKSVVSSHNVRTWNELKRNRNGSDPLKKAIVGIWHSNNNIAGVCSCNIAGIKWKVILDSETLFTRWGKVSWIIEPNWIDLSIMARSSNNLIVWSSWSSLEDITPGRYLEIKSGLQNKVDESSIFNFKVETLDSTKIFEYKLFIIF